MSTKNLAEENRELIIEQTKMIDHNVEMISKILNILKELYGEKQ